MKNKVSPFCSIVVLNYFGEKIIEQTIKHLIDLDYPKNRYEIIVVDNDSKDNSKNILKSLENKFSNIKIIFLDKNVGFSKGNNVGIKYAKGKYVCLLNNDCFVEDSWLKELVLTAEKDKKIFAVTPKLLLYPQYIYLRIKIGKDSVVRNTFLTTSNLLKYANYRLVPLDIIYSDDPNEGVFTLEIPFDQKLDNYVSCQISLFSSDSSEKYPPLKLIDCKEDTIRISYIKNEEGYRAILELDLKKLQSGKRYDKIQNAGIMVFQEGSGRDIGAIVRYHRQYYEFDKGQFDKEREVYGACAAASLYRRDVLNKIGYLDENFFMYYEDVEISERARLHGYKIYFNPKARVRHLHALSSKEWSPFFIYNVEKGRYLHKLFYFPYPIHLFVLDFFRLVLNAIGRLLLASNKEKSENSLQYLKLVEYFLIRFPWLLLTVAKKRSGISKNSLIENLNNIISGRWYFEKN